MTSAPCPVQASSRLPYQGHAACRTPAQQAPQVEAASLKTGGFAELMREVSAAARSAGGTAAAADVALTLGGRLDEALGLAAMTAADRGVVGLLRRLDLPLDRTADSGDRLFLTHTGRVVMCFDGALAPPDAHILGRLIWTGRHRDIARAVWEQEHRLACARLAAMHTDLAAERADAVHARLDRIEYALLHMAPVLLYVQDNVYSNLGKKTTLPGKSLAANSPRSLLNQLRARPAAEWSAEDACFVACLDILLASGPPVRAEEFNGAQLEPTALADFLVERIVGYGGPRWEASKQPTLMELTALAEVCARWRGNALARGLRPYRVINGLNLHKTEHLVAAPATLADVPGPVVDLLGRWFGGRLPLHTPIEALAPLWSALAATLNGRPGPRHFTSAFEHALHTILTATAESLDADVAMSRGPQRFDPLDAEPVEGQEPLTLGTGDFYCCVTPRAHFVRMFGTDCDALARTLSAYSARMRFNTWHYLPSTLGIVELSPGREDWFFAPTMPDLTQWSDQHHTGHVTFGVRYAIRVPFGIDYDGRALPGLYDLRLLRTGSPPFTVPELRAAIATGEVLRGLYGAMSAYRPAVVDFGRDWYRAFHAAPA